MDLNRLKEVSLVDVMERKLNIRVRRKSNGFLCRSPFRDEQEDSFNIVCGNGHWQWFDFGAREGGTIIDLAMRLKGLNDIGEGIKAAEELAEGLEFVSAHVAGIAVATVAPGMRPAPSANLSFIRKLMSRNDPAPATEYLIARKIDPRIVKRLERDSLVMANRLDGSLYCCIAVRDANGSLRCLFNRKMSGESGPDKFQIGPQSVFCLDHSALRTAKTVYVCESIIDALSIATLHPGAVALGLPGAGHDMSKLSLPKNAKIVAAFDDDDAGRSATQRLKESFPNQFDSSYDLEGAHDLNELLQEKHDGLSWKGPDRLTVEDRIEIALSGESSRALAEKYGIHHSRVCEIRKEATTMMKAGWSNVKRGRPPETPTESRDADEEFNKLKKLRDLDRMRIDFLNLKLKFLESAIKEDAPQIVKGAHKKKELADELMELYAKHRGIYPDYGKADHVGAYGYTPQQFDRMVKWCGDRAERESIVCEAEIAAAATLIAENPELGAGKLSLKLLDSGEAVISAGFINKLKKQVRSILGEEYIHRRESEKSMQSALMSRLEQTPDYVHVEATHPNHIWAIDFTLLRLFGLKMAICAIYDIYSQAYMAVEVSYSDNADLALKTVVAAEKENGGAAALILRRDNAKAFTVEGFKSELKAARMADAPVPPGKPWLNGALESNNTGLKSCVKSIGMLEMAEDQKPYDEARRDSDAALAKAQDLCVKTKRKLNEEVPRSKFGVTPKDAHDGKILEAKTRQSENKDLLLSARRKRISDINSGLMQKPKHKTFMAKSFDFVKHMARGLSTDKLFAIKEVLWHRYDAIQT